MAELWGDLSKTGSTTSTASAASKAKDKKDGSILGKDDFLKILITQLQNQDPMQPMQDKEFVAQMAQFTSVEQLSNMASEMKLLRSSLGFTSSLIGKDISWMSKTDSGETVMADGVVESIIVRDGVQYATVGGKEVKLEEVLKIENSKPAVPAP
ncbi:flagellar hook capping FlgD N-terminal domain-containing protein [Paenibacillus sp. UNC499MF]|uniref:flagellar hook capping FlgD N-terminal domain-containing protein n=1 Tax=Paenibacillus sp. UNC499MF TaxID=1502751 RepID=UPI00089FDAC3|nr:flagellar hook capping FlgD N-terminal domain-containing protein [Paenibacillus sp. UNC499MF]SEF57929.1 flagellar basal-body rod modification protein FlgD [Paenibacillus sp. UNC499MF]